MAAWKFTQGARLACAVFVWGCTGPARNDGNVESEQLLCPSCGPWAGGETGDFGGTPDFCERVTEEVALKFANDEVDVNLLMSRVQRPQELPLRWEETDGDAGVSASSHGVRTTLRVQVHIVGVTFNLRQPHPDFCNPSTCVFEGGEVSRAWCANRVTFDVHATVETTDGVVRGELEGVVVAKEVDGAFNEARGYLAGDLKLMRGTLSLAVADRLGPHSGVLRLSIDYKGDEASGTFQPELVLDQRRSMPLVPIRGIWGPES